MQPHSSSRRSWWSWGMSDNYQLQEIKLGQIGKFSTSSVDKKSIEGEGLVNLVNYMDVYNSNTIDGNIDFMKVSASVAEKARSQVFVGDILFTPSSETPEDIGHSAVVTEELPNTLHSYHTVRLRPFSNKALDLRFSAWFANLHEVRKQFSQKCAGSTRYTLSIPAFESVICNIPSSLKVQKKIALHLDTVQIAIEKTEALIHKYQQIKAGLMHDLFSRGLTADGELRPPREQAPEMYQETPIGWIPKGWDWGPLLKYLNGNPKNGYSPREIDAWDGCYALGLGCLTFSGFKAMQLKYVPGGVASTRGALLGDGDFLISRANTPHLVGLCGIYGDVGASCIYPDLMMRIRPNELIYAQFLEQYLLSAEVRIRLTALAVGTSSSMVKLNSKSLLNFFISAPMIDEQRLIVQQFKKIATYLIRLENDVAKLKQKKYGLMHDLLTGKVPVKIDQAESSHV